MVWATHALLSRAFCRIRRRPECLYAEEEPFPGRTHSLGAISNGKKCRGCESLSGWTSACAKGDRQMSRFGAEPEEPGVRVHQCRQTNHDSGRTGWQGRVAEVPARHY